MYKARSRKFSKISMFFVFFMQIYASFKLFLQIFINLHENFEICVGVKGPFAPAFLPNLSLIFTSFALQSVTRFVEIQYFNDVTSHKYKTNFEFYYFFSYSTKFHTFCVSFRFNFLKFMMR